MGIRLTVAFIFDFDGTLVDSEQAIKDCFLKVTSEVAPSRINYARNILIGPPLRTTASEILGPLFKNRLDAFIKQYIKIHDELVIPNTKPYLDVESVLKKIYLKEIPMAIATNKRLAPTQKLIDHFGWNSYFSFIECTDSQPEMRNKDMMIQDIINQNQSFHGSFFIGDTVNDGLSANLNQLSFIKACYGYGRDQDWSKVTTQQEIHQFIEILKLI